VNWLVAEGNRRRDLRIYFLALPVYLGAAVALVYALEFEQHIYALVLAYYSVCCSFFPGPTGAIMVWLNVPPAGSALDPVVVTLVAAIGTTIANLFDYHMIQFLMGYNLVGKLRKTTLYTVAERWFNRHPLLTIALWNLVPLPIDIARWLACMRGYPRYLFMLGSFLGRWPRYLAIAFGVRLISRWWLLDEQIVKWLLLLTAVAGVTRAVFYLWHFIRQRRKLIGEEHARQSAERSRES